MDFKKYDRFRVLENEEYFGWFLTVTRVDEELKIVFFKFDGENVERHFVENSFFAFDLVKEFIE